MYGNSLTTLKVNNCDGPIYIRNFFINSSNHDVNGVEVFDSHDVWLENCVSINNKVGFNFKNSKVYLNRGIVAYRNYGLNLAGERKTGSWHVSGPNIGMKEAQFLDDGAGLKSLNSEIILNTASSIYNRQGTDQTTHGSFEYEVFPAEFMINFSRNSFGVVLDNSVLHGGWAGEGTYLSGFNFNVELNNEYGIYVKNSVFDLNGRLKVYCNNRGMLLENSKSVLNECVVRGNQHEGIHAINSNIKYNKNLKSISHSTSPNDSEYQFDFSGNGRHLVLSQGSTFYPMLTSDMPSYYGQMRFLHHHGVTLSAVDQESSMVLSPIQIANNSNATFVHPIIRSFSHVGSIMDSVASGNPFRGECISVVDNSKVLLQASMNGASVVYGSIDGLTNRNAYNVHQKSAGVYAGNNSIVECNGPTVMYNFGVDILAENNSVINFNPPKAYEYGGIDASGWDLSDPKNHTSVELHSINSCLVAKNNSTLNMKDLGDYNACWGEVNASSPSYDTGVNGLNTSAYTSGGSMQFYPNPIGQEYYQEQAVEAEGQPAAAIINPYDTYKFQQGTFDDIARNYYLEPKPFEVDPFSVSSTAGGNCVRALGGSQVNVLNVNFPAGWWNASGLIYDVSGAEKGAAASWCNKLFIWNIADNSRLNASFCSVSGLDPRSVGYNGPSSVYSGVEGTIGIADTTAVYRAPVSTPDSSSLSVLDFYGVSPSARVDTLPVPNFSGLFVSGHALGTESRTGFLEHQLSTPLKFRQYGTVGSLENRGPFRLYVSVDPMTNYFSSISGTNSTAVLPSAIPDDGFARQLYAQGYNLSGPVSAGPTSLSATYGHSIRRMLGEGGDDLSGFIYNNEVVDPTTYNRILLDESAAHIFANAKNGAMGTSNRAKICKIYVSRINTDGEGVAVGRSDGLGKSFGRGYTSPDVFDLERRNE